ncbi:MAG: sialate O-acetylesterase [Terrimicrobiaceae bacterium]|nr:sialate O-acetylesterase [Terrimicrobiaceae bacterium]
MNRYLPALLLMSVGIVSAQSLSIVNPSFETDPVQGPSAPVFEIRTSAPAGWSYVSDPQAVRGLLAAGSVGGVYYPGNALGVDGANAYFTVNGPGRITQTLAETLQPNTTYTIALASGSRATNETFGGYEIRLETASGALVGTWSGASRNLAATGAFATTTRSFTTGATPMGSGEALRITVGQAGGISGAYADLDNIRITATAAPPRPSGTPIDVFLVAGQSNAHGWQANAAQLSSQNQHYAASPETGALLAYRQKLLGDSQYSSGSIGGMGTQGSGFAGHFDGFGPELAAGSDLASAQNTQVALLKFAVGSAGLNANFRKTAPTDPNPANHLYSTMLATFQESLQQLRDQGFDPQLKGLFWLQGENDTGSDASLYAANIAQFVSDLRADLESPELKVFLTEINGNMPVLRDNPVQAAGTVLVNAGMQSLAALDANVWFVQTSDITSGFADGIHYSADQTILIGQRWADAYMATIPEPSVCMLLAGAGLAGLAVHRRRKVRPAAVD